MLNEQIKQEYTKFKNATSKIDKSLIPRMFKRLDPYETEYGKDVCFFTKQEIIEMFRSWDCGSIRTLDLYNRVFKQYVEWCMENGKTTSTTNAFKEIRFSEWQNVMSESENKRKIINRSQILQWCGQLENPSDKFLLLAVFEGIRGNEYCELLELREADYHPDKHEVYIKSRDCCLNISTELCRIIEDTIDQMFYFTEHGLDVHRYLLFKSGYVLKFRDTNRTKVNDISIHQRSRRVYLRFARIFNKIGVENISIKALTLSGMMDYIETESVKHGVSKYKYWSNNTREIFDRFNISFIRKGDFYDEFKNYLK